MESSIEPVCTGCPFCGTGCALSVETTPKGFKVKGDKTNPSTLGDLCFKPIQMAPYIDKKRLTTPLYRHTKNSPFMPVSWEEAFSIAASRIRSLPKEALYFYLSGQLLTEESYLFTKLIKGHLGTNNVDANSRLCMVSAVLAHKMVFGSDGPVGSYADIDDADAIVISGSNPAWAHPVIFRRILARKKAAPQTTIVVIDPVMTDSAQKADLWIGLNGGSDTTLYNAVLAQIHMLGGCDEAFISRATEGFGFTLEEAMKTPVEEASRACGISPEDITALAELFATKKKIVGLWCQGLNQATDGVMRNLGFINLFLATGRMNAERGFPLSLTGQPNAMGGREVGYLSNGLPGYRDVRNKNDRRYCESNWHLAEHTISPDVGMNVTDAIESILQNKTELLWVACTNPLLTLPDVEKTRRALLKEDLFVIVQDCVLSETAEYANLILPSAAWGEKEGSMTNSERFIKRVRPFKSVEEGVLNDCDIICCIARKLALDGFDFPDVRSIYEEYRSFTSGRLCDQSSQEYNTLSYQWGGKALYADERYSTPSCKAQFHPIVSSSETLEEGEFILLTGRTKKQWHTMTRTGLSHELLGGEETPYVLMNRDEAMEMGLSEGDYAILSNPLGELRFSVRFGSLAQRHLYVPFGYASAPANRLVPVRNDPISGQSALKSARVKVGK